MLGMWILCDVLDEDHSLRLYHGLLRPGMKMFKLHTMIFKFHSMMTNKIISYFSFFQILSHWTVTQ